MSIRVWQGGTHDEVMVHITLSFCTSVVSIRYAHASVVAIDRNGGIFSGGLNQGLLLLRQKKAICESGKFFPSNQRVEIK